MTALLSRLRGAMTPTREVCAEAILHAAHDEELTDTQTDNLYRTYAEHSVDRADFDHWFTALRELVDCHTSIADFGDERAIRSYSTTDRDEAAARCENDVFEALDMLLRPKLTVVPGVA